MSAFDDVVGFLETISEGTLQAMALPELAALVPVLGNLAKDVEAAIAAKQTGLAAEVDAADVVALAAEDKKFPDPG